VETCVCELGAFAQEKREVIHPVYLQFFDTHIAHTAHMLGACRILEVEKHRILNFSVAVLRRRHVLLATDFWEKEEQSHSRLDVGFCSTSTNNSTYILRSNYFDFKRRKKRQRTLNVTSEL
jgi:hypothetical protein